MAEFSNQKVIISGATRGIGAGIARAFLDGGAMVAGIYGSDTDSALQFKESLGTAGERFSLHQCDISDEKQVNDFYSQYEAEHQHLDILINNAGVRRDGIVALLNTKDWNRVMDINLTGTFYMSKKAVLLMMKNRYGRIINITSPVAYLGFAGQSNYAASKAGQIALTKTLAKETARKKITVNAVAPGFISTDFIADLPSEQLGTYKKMVPMRRFGTVEEVAGAVLFLASSKASYITGATLDVSGGL